MTERQKQKWNSRRWRITLWAMIVISIIIGFSLYKGLDLPWIANSLTLLLFTPTAFIGSESYLKPKMTKDPPAQDK